MKLLDKLSLKFDRHFSKGLVQQLVWLVGIMAVVYVVLACLSYAAYLYSPGADEASHWYDRFRDIMLVLIDPGSGSESMSSTFTIICAVLGLIIFSGMLISVISNVLERRVESYNNGETDYDVSDHVVILGFNESTPSLLREIHKSHDGYIVLMCERESAWVRDWVHGQLDGSNESEREIEDMLIVMNGVRNADDDLDRLKLRNNVREIYIIGEEQETAHDSVSMKCVEMINRKLVGDGKIPCHVQLDSYTSYSILQKTDMKDIYKQLSLLPFNFNEIWAQKALATIPNDYRPLDGNGITKDSGKHVHLVIVGMNQMGWSLAVNAAHILHFPNFVEGRFDTYSKITFIDKEASEKGRMFRGRYNNLFNMARWREISDYDFGRTWTDPLADEDSQSPFRHLGPMNFMDIEWEFVEGDVYDARILNYLQSLTDDKDCIATIAICDDDADNNNSICLSLPEKVLSRSNEILVRHSESDILIKDVLAKARGFEHVKAFGMMDECYKENLLSDRYGKIVNACYYGASLSNTDEDNSKIDDAWTNCSALDRWSSNYCANMLFGKLRSLGLDTSKFIGEDEIKDATSDKNHEIIQKTEHNRWNTERLLLGMRPLYKEEYDEWCQNWKDKDKKEMKPEKNRQKKMMKHIDLCSNSTLYEVDKPTVEFDTTLNSCLYKLYEIVIKDTQHENQ